MSLEEVEKIYGHTKLYFNNRDKVWFTHYGQPVEEGSEYHQDLAFVYLYYYLKENLGKGARGYKDNTRLFNKYKIILTHESNKCYENLQDNLKDQFCLNFHNIIGSDNKKARANYNLFLTLTKEVTGGISKYKQPKENSIPLILA